MVGLYYCLSMKTMLVSEIGEAANTGRTVVRAGAYV